MHACREDGTLKYFHFLESLCPSLCRPLVYGLNLTFAIRKAVLKLWSLLWTICKMRHCFSSSVPLRRRALCVVSCIRRGSFPRDPSGFWTEIIKIKRASLSCKRRRGREIGILLLGGCNKCHQRLPLEPPFTACVLFKD